MGPERWTFVFHWHRCIVHLIPIFFKIEVIEEIQDKVAPLKNLKTAPVNSARDQKLREEQNQIAIKNETIEQVLERDSSNVPIATTDKSSVMFTSNENMKKITFTNFDKIFKLIY